ncbi:MAG TPA: hypothetical protein VIT91_15595 [Chthoniobacterales bacterium]
MPISCESRVRRFYVRSVNRAISILALSAACALHAAPFYDKVLSNDFSPHTDILVQHYFERGGTDQIWLVSTADPSKRRLLFTHQRHAEVVFSPDQKWLVINNHCLSNKSRLLLYHQKAPLDYEQVADLTDAAWQFFDEQHGRTKPTNFDHSYIEALRWADDEPPTLLLYLDGHGDSRNHTSDWYCLYDVQAKTFSVDFVAHNKKATKLEPE